MNRTDLEKLFTSKLYYSDVKHDSVGITAWQANEMTRDSGNTLFYSNSKTLKDDSKFVSSRFPLVIHLIGPRELQWSKKVVAEKNQRITGVNYLDKNLLGVLHGNIHRISLSPHTPIGEFTVRVCEHLAYGKSFLKFFDELLTRDESKTHIFKPSNLEKRLKEINDNSKELEETYSKAFKRRTKFYESLIQDNPPRNSNTVSTQMLLVYSALTLMGNERIKIGTGKSLYEMNADEHLSLNAKYLAHNEKTIKEAIKIAEGKTSTYPLATKSNCRDKIEEIRKHSNNLIKEKEDNSKAKNFFSLFR